MKLRTLSLERPVNSFQPRAIVAASGLVCAAFAVACGGGSGQAGTPDDSLQVTVGPKGADIVGPTASALEGVHLVIPAGAVTADTQITIRPADASTTLPSTAVGCGPAFTIEPSGLKLAMPATLTLPFDETTVTNQDRFDDEVKVWVLTAGKWGQALQTDSSEGQVTISLDTMTTVEAGVTPVQPTDEVKFSFHPNPKFLPCIAAYPNDSSKAPTVTADVVRGELNDGMFLRGQNFKPNLQFDLFTVQNSSLLADGTVNPNFTNFGLAWYQTDLNADGYGSIRAQIRTILLDQIFGFDPTVTLPPTGTFEVGFWFNNPQDAVACGFDATKPTPFNGEHDAGPLAMITVPDATTGLGPLCTKPDTSVSPAQCSE
jgi:hypothetical protein